METERRIEQGRAKPGHPPARGGPAARAVLLVGRGPRGTIRTTSVGAARTVLIGMLVAGLGGPIPGVLTGATRAEEPATVDWCPPLAPPLYLTGTVGEPRAGHLHGGIDLSTGREIGRPVRAVADGSVVRVRAGGAGYGRAVYLQTNSGLTAVYGHLDHFAPKLEAYVRGQQEACGEFEVDLFPEAGAFRFSRGEILAYSGETGAGPPHLHFELRRGEDQLNPLALGIVAYDNVAPALGPIRLRALDEHAWVDGAAEAERRLPATEPVRVWGRVGVEIGVLDRTGQNTSRLAPARMRLLLDDRLIFARAFARIDLLRPYDVRRVYGRACAGSSHWVVRLYRWPGGTTPDTVEEDPSLGDGIVDASLLPPGSHALRVEVEDAAGHWDAVSWAIEVKAPLVPLDWCCEPDEGGGWLCGLHLAEPLDDRILPLRLGWRPVGSPPAGAGGSAGAAASPAGAGGETGWLALGQGWFAAHVPESGRLELEVRDAAGKRILPPFLTDGLADLSSASVRARIAEGGCVLELRCPGPLAGLPRLEVPEGQGASLLAEPRGPVGDGVWTFALDCPAQGAPQGPVRNMRLRVGGAAAMLALEDAGLVATRQVATPGADATFRVGPLTVRGELGTFPSPLFLEQEVWSPGEPAWEALAEAGRAEGDGGLRLLSPVVMLGPEWWHIEEPVSVAFDPEVLVATPESPRRRWGLYRLVGKDSWRWVGQVDATGPPGGTTSTLGRWALLEDAQAPLVEWGEPRTGARLADPPARLRAAVTDVGSGFDLRDADIFIDGRMLLAEWDIDAGVLSAPVPAGLARGPHRWEVRVVDRAGNAVSREFDFRTGVAKTSGAKGRRR